MIHEKIYSSLLADPSVSGLTSTIRPIFLEQGDTLPAITYQIDFDHAYVFEGQSSLLTATVEINVMATSLVSAHELTGYVKTALKNTEGVDANFIIYQVRVAREIEDFESDPEEFRINLQFTIQYSEA